MGEPAVLSGTDEWLALAVAVVAFLSALGIMALQAQLISLRRTIAKNREDIAEMQRVLKHYRLSRER